MNPLNWFRRRRPSPASTDQAKKTAAAVRELDRVRDQWPVVLRYAGSLDEHRHRNHFSELIAGIYKGER